MAWPRQIFFAWALPAHEEFVQIFHQFTIFFTIFYLLFTIFFENDF